MGPKQLLAAGRLLVALAVLVMCVRCQQCLAQDAFLQEQLPLTVLVTTPTALSDSAEGTSVTLTGRQAITAVFSRPVIALGSDWGTEELPASLVPFTLSCKTPGRLRWVTTNIARFDPVIEWPTDLDCSFDWNKGLKTFDGAPLVLGEKASVKLLTRPLSMELVSVASKAASEATDNQWSATLGLPDDQLPEVPPDGNITLSFSYPVELSKLGAALKLAGPGAGSRAVTVSPCPAVVEPPLWPIVFSASGVVPAGSPAGAATLNSTCAIVRIVPGLAAGSAAVLRLPKGARYSPYAGPVQTDTDVKVFGLRPFRIPLRQDFMNVTSADQNIYNGVKYRRLVLWLPHGLAAGTELSAVKPLIQICTVVEPFGKKAPCLEQAFELSWPTKGTLVMAVPELAPRQQYRVAIKASAAVKDAFGLPLQASSDSWWTVDLDTAFQGPNINQVALLEAGPAGATLEWPWVSRGKPEEGVDKVQAWGIDAGSSNTNELLRTVAALNNGFSGVEQASFGPPDSSITRASTPNPTFQQLLLSGKPGISFVGSCCRSVTWPKPRKVLASSVVVVQSNLQAAFAKQAGQLVAWVTTTQGESKPVAGATVQLYYSQYGKDLALLGPSCKTSSDGSCVIDLAASAARSTDSSYLTALVTAAGEGPLLVPSVPSFSKEVESPYVGTLVLDRALIKPGDDLHVTAFIQQRSGTQLKAPAGLATVLLQITPSLNASSPDGYTRLPVAVNATYGTSHAVISVPKTATPADYQLSLYTLLKGAASPAAASPGSAFDGDMPLPEAAALPIPTSVADSGSPPIIADGVVPSVGLQQPVAMPGDFITSTGFTVADPRPPTATLSLKAPAWVLPDASVTVTLQAESYIGSDVSGANMTLEWSTPKAKGTLQLTTNASGIATGKIELGKLPAANATSVGDALDLKATWIGPTREPLLQSKSVKIADGPLRVELSRTLQTDVPGMLFGVKADAFSNEDDKPVDGETVEVSLVPANESTSLANCSAAQVALLKSQSCSIKSGDVAGALACQLQLPCPGEFLLRGCVASGGGAKSCGTPLRVGRNATWWELAPWSAPPEPQLLADTRRVAVGQPLSFVVQNPWWGSTSALLVWGNKVRSVHKVVPQIPRGVSRVTISKVGEECRGTCNLALIMAVARPSSPPAARATTTPTASGTNANTGGSNSKLTLISRFSWPFTFEIEISTPILDLRVSNADATAVPAAASQAKPQQSGSSPLPLPGIPTSKLFDPLAPRTVTAKLDLPGEGPQPLQVNVTVAGQATAADGTAVLAPQSGKGSIRVAVRDASGQPVAGAEVTLVVVDKAVLDLKPYALQNVTAAVAPDLSDLLSITELNALRVTRPAINASFTALQHRLTRLDPWLPVDTTVQPGSFYPAGNYLAQPQPAPADVSDARYLASYTTPITPLPFRPCDFGRICPVAFGGGAAYEALPMLAMASDGAMPVAMAASTAAPMAAPVPMPSPAALPRSANNAMAKSAAGGSAAAAGGGDASLRLQQDFKTTPLFTVLKTGADGSAVAAFTAPDNLGRFVVRAYVAQPQPKGADAAQVAVVYGAAESQLLVRRTVSLTPALPRQVRADDNFTAGVVVDAPGTTSATSVTVTAALVPPTAAAAAADGGVAGPAGNALALDGPTSVTVQLSPGKTQGEARFNFRARALGTQNITFTVAGEAGDGAVADRVQLEVPVLGKQGPVWIATSFAVRGSNSSSVANRVEGLALPRAENGSGYISLVAGVGYLPAIQATYEALVRQGGLTSAASKPCPSGAASLALSVIPAMLAMYQPKGAPISAFLTERQVSATLAAMSDAATLLTDATYGLLPVDLACLSPGSPDPGRADIALNAWAAWLLGQLDTPGPGAAAAAKGSAGASIASRWAGLDTASATWRKALQAQLVADATAARKAQPPVAYSDFSTLSWARLVLGAGWVPPASAGADVARDLSMQRLVAAAGNESVGTQARVGLALLEQAKGAATPEVKKIVQRLLSAVRVGGRTAYVAAGEGERGAAPLADQSLALLLFLRSRTDNPLIQKVAAWVAQGAAPPPLPLFAPLSVSSNPWESALRARALSAYDDATDSTAPDLALKAVAQLPLPAASPPVELLSARFNASSAGSVARQTSRWEKVPPGSSLFFNARGRGEVSVAASLNFTPAEALPFPTYRGLWVQRVVQPSGPAGGSIAAVGLGKLVVVAVQVTSPDDQSGVVVEVLMPGGLEPLDTNVFSDPDLATTCRASEDESDLSAAPPPAVPFGRPVLSIGGFNPLGGGSSSPYSSVPWWLPWPVCPVQTTTPAAVSFRFDYFRAGTQTLRFAAVSATSGSFILPPVKAYVAQQPEVMGLSAAGRFTVCPTADDCAAAQQPAAAGAAAKACPGDCSGAGACNLASGQCICDAGFSGPSCAEFKSW